MAAEGEEGDYESDPEEAMLPLAMRRREASDDEEGDAEERVTKELSRARIGSDGESDGQGAAQVYEDDESEIGEEDEEEEVEEVEEEDEEEHEVEEEEFEGRESEGGGEVEVGAAAAVVDTVSESVGEPRGLGGEVVDGSRENNQEADEVKKENEPFAVPTAGAFYMHDDRFQANGRGRHRRTSGGRKLWESKDNRAWEHDKFEEMNLQDAHHDEERRRNGKGRFRGRGRFRGADRGYARGNTRVYDEGNNQNRNYRGVRGRGPRRYEPPTKNKTELPATQNKKPGRYLDRISNANSGRVTTQASNVQPDMVPPQKQVFASSLSSASPPFYPSGSSNQDISVTSKRDTLIGSTNRNFQSSVPSKENLSTSHSTSLVRGKTIAETNGLERSYVNDSIRSVTAKQLNNLQLQSSGSSLPLSARQSAQPRSQGRGTALSGQVNYQPTASPNQANRGSAPTQIPVVPQRSVQAPVQPSFRGSPQQLGQRPGSGTQASVTQASSTNSSEGVEMESPPGSGKSKTSSIVKGKDSIQASGKGSFLYSGAQVIGSTGAMGLAHGDQNFSATPALLPVMQFGGQHHGGLGVPAVGMALPGYVAQPHGFGNSEMTWVPVLAGAAGALGASYCSPYIAVDGSYYTRSSGQTSSLGGSKETVANKPDNGWKPSQGPELVNDEFGQRQNKPRRYSEMNFGQ